MTLSDLPTDMRAIIWHAILLPMAGLIAAACVISGFFYYNLSHADIKDRVDGLAAANTHKSCTPDLKIFELVIVGAIT